MYRLKRCGFQGRLNEQQDAHDTWLRLNDRLEHELRTSKRPRLVNELFEGKQKQYVTCGTCGATSETVEPFSCLELNVPEGDEVAAAVVMPDPGRTLALSRRRAVLGRLSLAQPLARWATSRPTWSRRCGSARGRSS